MSQAPPYRLDKIYTRKGDQGTTCLGDGTRVHKTHARIEAVGTVDELNSWLGLLLYEYGLSEKLEEQLLSFLQQQQHHLLNMGGELATPNLTLLPDHVVGDLENAIDRLNQDLAPLKNFILPAGNKLTCTCHMARTVARRAERCISALSTEENRLRPELLAYINRLSDFLFVLARWLGRHEVKETLWDQPRKPD